MAVRSGLRLTGLLTKSMLNCSKLSQRGFNRNVRKASIELKKRQAIYFEELTKSEKLELEKRSNYAEWNYSAEVFAFGKRLKEDFKPELLTKAFIQRSYVVQEKEKLKEVGVDNVEINLEDNSDLAKEGESIISYYVPRYVSHFFPRFPLEGINAIHDYLMSEETLAYISKNLGTTFLILSADYPVEPTTYSTTLKALIGALLQSQNEKTAYLFVRDFIVTQLAGKDVNDYLQIKNYLEVLNDILKRDGKEECEPRILCETAVNTILANYHVGVYSNKQLIGHSSGESIDTAIQMAALNALKRLFHTTDSCSPITYDLETLPETVSNLTLSEWNSAAFENN